MPKVIHVELEDALHARLVAFSKAEDRSLTRQVRHILNSYTGFVSSPLTKAEPAKPVKAPPRYPAFDRKILPASLADQHRLASDLVRLIPTAFAEDYRRLKGDAYTDAGLVTWVQPHYTPEKAEALIDMLEARAAGLPASVPDILKAVPDSSSEAARIALEVDPEWDAKAEALARAAREERAEREARIAAEWDDVMSMIGEAERED